ncbi:MAG TPA: S41 family peptidase [Firmicutes bacterium]|nr:S41 family peptidase [Bacillota bacterium]
MNNFTRQKKIISIIIVAALVVGVSCFLSRRTGAGANVVDSPFEDLRTVMDVIALIKMEYVEPVSAADLMRAYLEKGTINGMLQTVLNDRYTRYLDPPAYKQMQIDTTGTFAGIGITVGMLDGQVTVIAPIPNTPGHRQGLRSGDRIVKIDDRDTQYMGLDEAVSLMRGKEGTSVTLTIERGKKEKKVFEVTIVRAVIEVPSITSAKVLAAPEWPTAYPIGYIRMTQFSERTAQELDQAMKTLEEQGIQGLVLDLRYNPGGLFTTAIEVADRFLTDGPIVHKVGRGGQSRETYSAKQPGTYRAMPLVVLVNEWSASASEIVSGALQDQGVAVLVGTRTFGKGLVQSIIPMRNGSALSLTSDRYQTAGGRDIDQQGIEPDVVVEWPEPEEGAVQEESLAEDEAGEEESEEIVDELLPQEEEEWPLPDDIQLLKALEVLQDKQPAPAATPAAAFGWELPLAG